jgi:N,N'-diacetyllegionaminate synthase
MILFNKDLKQNKNIIFVAEIGVNHEGSLAKAKKLIILAKEAGADAVKFQSFNLDRYCSIDEIERYKKLKKFEFKPNEFYELYKFARKNKIFFFSTAVTEDYVGILKNYCEVIKIASGDMSFLPVIDEILKSKTKFIISTGMHNQSQIDNLIAYIIKKKSKKFLADNVALMQCTTSYPPNLNEINLNVIKNFKNRYNMTVGYSNHIVEEAACLASVALGAKIIEVHFTDKRKGKKFHDHFISFEPSELKKLINLSKKIITLLGTSKKEILNCEKKFLKSGKKGLVFSRDLKKGTRLDNSDIIYARPAKYFSFDMKNKIIGSKLKKDVKMGELIKKRIIH